MPDPNNNNNYLYAMLAALGFLGWASYQKPLPELLYSEFYNDYLTKNQVKEISIKKDKNQQNTVFNHRAEITMVDGSKHSMTLGS
jgi:hypothetical protein